MTDNLQSKRWTLFGKVHPERFPVTWPGSLSGHLVQPDFEVEADYSISIHVSQIIVDVSITKGNPNIDSIKNLATGLARQLTDIVGYASGCCFDVDMISAKNKETDDWHVFGIANGPLVRRGNPHRSSNIPGDLLLAAAHNVHAGLALRDFQYALRDAAGTGFYCYRAVEAMMQSIKQETDDKKTGWERFNTCLVLNRSASGEIKRHADFPRHGKPSSISEEERITVLEITDEILRRFLEFLKRGEALSVNEFPQLVGEGIP